MQRLWEFGKKTYLSEGDLLRLTNSMIDERQGKIKSEGGRKKDQGRTGLAADTQGAGDLRADQN